VAEAGEGAWPAATLTVFERVLPPQSSGVAQLVSPGAKTWNVTVPPSVPKPPVRVAVSEIVPPTVCAVCAVRFEPAVASDGCALAMVTLASSCASTPQNCSSALQSGTFAVTKTVVCSGLFWASPLCVTYEQLTMQCSCVA